jgi:hypothetical protein
VDRRKPDGRSASRTSRRSGRHRERDLPCTSRGLGLIDGSDSFRTPIVLAAADQCGD